MRIEAYGQIQQLYNAKKPAAVKKDVKTSFADQVQISSLGKDIQTAKSAVASAADVREDKIADIKNRINNGTYDVDMDDFASKLIGAYKGIF
ncbi:MAG: flagellar biosynthesis anti-sigma factor FlgM [Lachnospiraceae bacterium]|nr:flagellar biosynthesis anti-sigma factor FlgM [Candidatus Merdinaster equi]